MTSIITPSVEFERSYNSYINELGNEERYPYPLDLDHSNFAQLVHTLNDYAKGLSLPEFLVPNTTFWLIQDNEIVGCAHLRHTLNPSLAHAGGHIGIGIRPSKRGLGLGKKLLANTIQKGFKMGITPIHIHCYQSNGVSQRLIESVGGSLGSSVRLNGKGDKDGQEGETVLRYLVSPQ